MLGVTASVTGRLMTSADAGAALVVGTAVLVVGAALQFPRERQHQSDVDGAFASPLALYQGYSAPGLLMPFCAAVPHPGAPVVVEGKAKLLVGGAVGVRATVVTTGTGVLGSNVVAGAAVLVSGAMVVVAGAAVVVRVVGTTVEVVGAAVDGTAAVVVLGALQCGQLCLGVWKALKVWWQPQLGTSCGGG